MHLKTSIQEGHIAYHRNLALQKEQGTLPEKQTAGLWDKDGFDFGDIVDIVNPLQQIPILSDVYRAVTDDDMGIAPRMIGGTIFGGAIGFVVSAISSLMDARGGKDMGETVIAAAGYEKKKQNESLPQPAAIQNYQRTQEIQKSENTLFSVNI